MGLKRFCDYKPTNAFHADSAGVFTIEKILNLGKTDKIHLECDCFDGSLANGIRQPIIFSFDSDKLSGYKIFCQPEKIDYEKINKSVLNTITVYTENNNNEKINLKGESWTFTIDRILNY